MAAQNQPNQHCTTNFPLTGNEFQPYSHHDYFHENWGNFHHALVDFLCPHFRGIITVHTLLAVCDITSNACTSNACAHARAHAHIASRYPVSFSCPLASLEFIPFCYDPETQKFIHASITVLINL